MSIRTKNMKPFKARVLSIAIIYALLFIATGHAGKDDLSGMDELLGSFGRSEQAQKTPVSNPTESSSLESILDSFDGPQKKAAVASPDT
jgi:hypothetical protein